ncbi:MAG: Poly(A) polymerase I [candidate division WS2 bacterium]|nr:Poly(A) polymerase I [Candidatus Psychracetigena formicireducens]
MKCRVLIQPYPDINQLEEDLDYQFLSSEGITEGFLLGSDIRALQLLNLKDYHNYFHLPEFSQIIQKQGFWKKIKANSKSIKVKIPEKVKMVFNLAEKEGVHLYLVGGAVRDLLLGRTHREEWDLVVPKKLDTFLSLLKTDQRFKIKHYPDYYTVNLRFTDNSSLDLARPRYEYYSPPGKVNKINRAPFFQDLLRRDFTINSLVLFPENGSYRLVDMFGGLEDLKKRRIRLLRAYGFMEDPLRILRAIRYAVTLDLRLAKREANLLEDAIKKVIPYSDSYLDARFGRELKLLLSVKTENLAEMVDEHPFLGLIDSRFNTVNGEKIRKLIHLWEITPENSKPSRGDVILLFLSSLLERETADNLLRKLNLKIKYVDYENFMKNKDMTVEQIFLKAPLKVINNLILIYLTKSDYTLEECQIKYQSLLMEYIKAEELIKSGFSPGPILEQIIRDVKFLSYNGYLTSWEEALKYVKNSYLKHKKFF